MACAWHKAAKDVCRHPTPSGARGPYLQSGSPVSYCLFVNFGHSVHLSNRSVSGMRLAVKIALVLLVLGGAMYLFVFPARTYLAQKQEIAAEEQTVAVLKAEDSKLTSQSSALQDSATIEQIARQQYGLVKPGQQAFMVLPATGRPQVAAPAPPKHAAWYSSLEFWHYL